MLKLSQMQTSDEHLDILFDLLDIVDGIVADDAFRAELGKVATVANGLKIAQGTEKLTDQQILQAVFLKRKTFVALLLKDKRDDVLRVLSLMKQMSLGDVKAQPLPQTAFDLYQLFNDKELIGFFTPRAEETEPTETT